MPQVQLISDMSGSRINIKRKSSQNTTTKNQDVHPQSQFVQTSLSKQNC
jgi:hypothetical protein